MTNYTVKDSGERIDFPTGSKRDTNAGKPRFDLISVFGMRELAEHMAKGAEKYGERNWELGQNTSRSYESALRHLAMWQYDDSENHLAAAVFNIFSIIHVKTLIKMGVLDASLDDATRFIAGGHIGGVVNISEAAVLHQHYEGLTVEEFQANFTLTPRFDQLAEKTALVLAAQENEQIKQTALKLMSDKDLANELRERGYDILP